MSAQICTRYHTHHSCLRFPHIYPPISLSHIASWSLPSAIVLCQSSCLACVPLSAQHKRPFCNSIGCPHGYAPVDDAQHVKCDGDVCERDECCQAMCACFPCPDGSTPIMNELYELCRDNECTVEQCCEKREWGGNKS